MTDGVLSARIPRFPENSRNRLARYVTALILVSAKPSEGRGFRAECGTKCFIFCGDRTTPMMYANICGNAETARFLHDIGAPYSPLFRLIPRFRESAHTSETPGDKADFG